MSRSMVAFLAGMGGGYLKGREQARRQEYEEEDRAARKEERDFQRGERERVTATRNRLADAAAPVTMQSVLEKPDYADNRDVGQPGVELIDTGARRVGQQTFAPGQMQQATAALAEANKPGAAAARQADVLAASGDPVGAQSVRAGARQEKLGELQLDEAQRNALNRQFDDALNASVNSWTDLPTFVNDSKHDGQGGNLKIQAQPTADGKKMQILKLNADGSTTPTSLTFSNDATGLMQAKAFISKGLSASDKLQHLHQQATIDRADAAQRETVRHNQRMEGIAADRTAANIEIASMRATAAAQARAAKAGDGTLTMADLKDGHKAIAATLNADYKTQIDSEVDPAKTKAIKTARETETAMVQRLFTGAAQAGIAMTPEQAIAAFRTGEVGKQSFKTTDGKTQQVDVIRVNGRIIPLMDEPGFAAAAAAKTPPPAPAPAAPPAAGPSKQTVAGAAAAPAPAPAAPAAPLGMQQTGDATLNAIKQQNLAAMQPLNEAVAQAREQLAAVAKSGDPKALSRYAAALQQAINTRNASAEKFFGNSAPQYLASVGQ